MIYQRGVCWTPLLGCNLLTEERCWHGGTTSNSVRPLPSNIPGCSSNCFPAAWLFWLFPFFPPFSSCIMRKRSFNLGSLSLAVISLLQLKRIVPLENPLNHSHNLRPSLPNQLCVCECVSAHTDTSCLDFKPVNFSWWKPKQEVRHRQQREHTLTETESTCIKCLKLHPKPQVHIRCACKWTEFDLHYPAFYFLVTIGESGLDLCRPLSFSVRVFLFRCVNTRWWWMCRVLSVEKQNQTTTRRSPQMTHSASSWNKHRSSDHQKNNVYLRDWAQQK